MTVLRMNSYQQIAAPQQRGHFADTRPQPVCRQVQSWNRGMESAPGRRQVIAGRSSPLPAFSSRGVRWDVLVISLVTALVMFLAVLFADMEALASGGARIGRLSAEIDSLDSSNTLLQEEITLRMQHPVLSRTKSETGTEEETVITLSAFSNP